MDSFFSSVDPACILDSLEQAVLALDRDARVVHANAAALRWLSEPASLQPLIGQPVTPVLQALDSALRQQLLAQWPLALQGQPQAALHGRLGSGAALSACWQAWRNTAGEPLGLLLVLMPQASAPADKLEELVLQRTAELRLTRDEMEAFSYSVSHDLRTPLSAMDGFSSMLEQELSELPPEQAVAALKYLSRIRAGVHQMGELIDALLSLARLSRAALHLGEVDFSRLAGQVLDGLHEREPSRPAKWTVQPGLTAQGDARLLKLLLENLLGNAWKFSRHQAPTQIEVGWAPDAQGGAFFVRDHGAGFDMAYAERLFNPFQRLHSPAEFEGTGIGLATVQRIVKRHGGRVWASSQPGQGATFYFTLGADAAQQPDALPTTR